MRYHVGSFVRVVTDWSNYEGKSGIVVKVNDDHVMLRFDFEDRPLRFGLDEIESVPS
jgi:hypothetical protein